MSVFIQSHCNLSGWGGGGRLLTFSAFMMGAYLRCALIRGWALIRINTVCQKKSGELKGLCQLESMRSGVMQITFNCQNSIVFNV